MADIDYRSIFGAVDETHWAQTFTSPKLLLCCEAEGKNAQKTGRAFLKDVQSRIRKHSPSTLSDFKKLLESTASSSNLSGVSALIVGKMLYVVIWGAGFAYIKRNDTLAPLLSSAGSASGELKANDTLLFASKHFAADINIAVLNNYLESLELQKITEKLTINQLKDGKLPYGCAIILRIRDLDIKNGLPFQTIDQVSHWKNSLRAASAALKTTIINFRKPLLFLGFLILVLLGSMVFVLLAQNKSNETSVKQELFAEIDASFSEGMAFVGVDAGKSRELLQKAKILVETQLANMQDESLKNDLVEKLKQIEAGLKSAQQEFETELTPFYDLALLKNGAQAESLAMYQDILVLFDRQNQLLYRVAAQSKAGKILAHSDKLGAAKSLAVHGENIYIAADAIYELTLADSSFREIIPHDDTWGNVTVIKVFSGNLYLMDISKNWVFKYFKTEEGWGERQDYFVFDTLVNLNGASEMVIDGYVWIAKPGEILRFSQGSEDVWQVSGLSTSLGTHLDIYADETLNNLYILDQGNKRVVVVNKKGEYLAQYKWEEDAQISDFVVSEVLKKILLLSGGTIYGIDLK